MFTLITVPERGVHCQGFERFHVAVKHRSDKQRAECFIFVLQFSSVVDHFTKDNLLIKSLEHLLSSRGFFLLVDLHLTTS